MTTVRALIFKSVRGSLAHFVISCFLFFFYQALLLPIAPFAIALPPFFHLPYYCHFVVSAYLMNSFCI